MVNLLIIMIMIIMPLVDILITVIMIIYNIDGHCDEDNPGWDYYDVIKCSPSGSSELSMMKISFSNTSQLSMLPSLKRRRIWSLRQMVM